MTANSTSRYPTYVSVSAAGFGLLMSGIGLWANRHLISPDGISYLDYSDHFLDGTWRSIPNGYWSPGYPLLTAMIRRIIGTGPDTDILALHASAFTGFVVSALAFAFLLRAICTSAKEESIGTHVPHTTLIAALGWLTFFWTSFSANVPFVVTPDSWVSASTYLATALMLVMYRRRVQILPALALGVTLAGGYLFKAVMFPVAVMMLLTLGAVQLYRRSSLWPVLLSFAMFAALVAPHVITQTRLKGSPSIGQVGSLAYAWYAGGVPCPLWPRERDCMAAPGGMQDPLAIQPFPRLTNHPSVFFFPKSRTATFPVWYDASKWYTRARPRFSLHAQYWATKPNLKSQWSLIAPFVIASLAWMFTLGPAFEGPTLSSSLLIIPSIATLALYALTYSEGRYLGPAVTLLVLGVAPVASVQANMHLPSRRFMVNALSGASVVLLASSTLFILDHAWESRHEPDAVARSAHEVAAAGVAPFSRIGIIGNGYEAYWARYNRAHIVAEIHESEAELFWNGDSRLQEQALNAFRQAGATAVVADPAPSDLPPGWKRAPAASHQAVYRF